MIYQYGCDCGSVTEFKSKFGQASDPSWEPPDTLACSICGESANMMFTAKPLETIEDQTELKSTQNPFSGSSQFQLVGGGFSRQDMRINEHIREVDSLMDQEVIREEVEVGMELLREREIAKGLPEGHLSGERPTEDVVVKEISYSEKARMNAKNKEKVKKVMSQDGLVQYVTPDQVEDFREGRETVVTKKAKPLGAEDMKRRSEEQRQMRQG